MFLVFAKLTILKIVTLYSTKNVKNDHTEIFPRDTIKNIPQSPRIKLNCNKLHKK
jgi:hypothetical protein